MAPLLNNLLEKRISFCSSFKTLSTDTSFIKIGVCYQKLSTLEGNFHYQLSSHCVIHMFCMCKHITGRGIKESPKKFLEC